MVKPKYMRFFPDAYLEDTFTLNMEEQGIYMRLLCLMWTHGGKIPSNDKMIARLLGIHSNKWLKVKPQIMPFLSEFSPDFLTIKTSYCEYTAPVDNSCITQELNLNPTLNTPIVTPLDTHGVTPLDTPLVQGVEIEENQWEIFQTRKKNKIASLDIDSSRSLDKIKTRLDGGEQNCGKLSLQTFAEKLLNELQEVFLAHGIEMPTDHEILFGWVEVGINPSRHILPSIKRVLSRLLGGACDPPKSWKYFAKEVYRQQKIGEQYGKAKK